MLPALEALDALARAAALGAARLQDVVPDADVAAPADAVPGTPGARAVAALVLVACSAALVPLVRRLLRAGAPREDARTSPWGLADVVAVAATVLLTSTALVVVLAEASLVAKLVGQLVAFAAGVAVAIARARGAGTTAADAFSWRLEGLPRASAVAVAGYVLLWPGLLGVQIGWSAVLELFSFDVGEQVGVTAMREIAPGDRPFAALLGVVLVPLFEELLFRGFLQRALEARLRGAFAVVATAVVFGALHGLAAFVPVLALGLVLGGVAHATRRVLAAWVLHALFNAQTFVFLWWDRGASPGLWIG